MPKADEVALEIGPGKGIITRYLAKSYRRVIAIEKDTKLWNYLQNLPDNVEVIWGDALKVRWPPFDALVSNLPFSIASPVIFRLLPLKFRVAVLGIQKEVAERLIAAPGSKEYSKLSVAAKLFFKKVEVLRILPPGAFEPPPKVYTAMVRILPREERPPMAVIEFTKKLFSYRRKKVKNALELSGYAAVAPEKILEKRVYELSPEEFLMLFKSLEPYARR